jgi:hypothetical protein
MLNSLEEQRSQWRSRLAQVASEQASLRKAVLTSASLASTKSFEEFSPELTNWLAAQDFSGIPPALVAELRMRLDLSEDNSSDYVLISKPTMETLRPRSPGKNDKLSDGICALLSIGPEQLTKIESALSGARGEFTDWARQNVVRDLPEGETLVRYTLPAANDFADAVTNRLLTAVSDIIGTQRSALFRTYAETWFQIEMGYLGGVTNTLSVLKMSAEDGQPGLYYKLSREGATSSMSEGPGKINAQWFPPAWQNIFPGGWAEVAEREGFTLQVDSKVTVK